MYQRYPKQEDGKKKERAKGSGTSFYRGNGKRRSFNLKDSARDQATKRHCCTVFINFQLRGNVQNAKRSGRPPKTTPRDDRRLQKLIKDDRRASATKLARKWSETMKKTVSAKTAKRRLNSMGYHGRQALKKPYISAKNKKKRLEWAREMKDKGMVFWKKIVFTDESKIKAMDGFLCGANQRKNGYLAALLAQLRPERGQSWCGVACVMMVLAQSSQFRELLRAESTAKFCKITTCH